MPEDIIYYKDEDIVITEVYTIVFNSSDTSTNQGVAQLGRAPGLGPGGFSRVRIPSP